ncbi:hypothetical protein [Winogradskyella sp.]|uniref:hypothetical protein n=1 Tax=Winogradskyella sp. TaxID=1883156 RepID=UPI003F6CB2A6
MKTKLQIGILIMLFAFLGTYVEHTSVPNQQIVIQFEDGSISASDAESAINNIREKLHNIGAEAILIGDNEDGRLKITYYSDAAIDIVQNVLSQETDYSLYPDSNNENPFKTPISSDEHSYQLNISEIQNSGSNSWDFEGTQVVELNHKSDRFNHLKVNSSAKHNSSNAHNVLCSNELIKAEIIAFYIDSLSYKIPEVRAGPLV